ncbi:MAG: SMP-30/gluconolactonase/LRE family protein, partial [Pigmentiphaga sp.]
RPARLRTGRRNRKNPLIEPTLLPTRARRAFIHLAMGTMAVAGPSTAFAQGLAYGDAREAVPIPPAERSLQTVVAEPWISLPGVEALEGPAFERDGNLVFSDVSGQRVLRADKDGKVSTVFHRANTGVGGLAIDAAGRIVIASIDIAGGTGAVLSIRPDGSDLRTLVPPSAGLMPNDVVFDRQGGIYISDFRGTATDPRGGIYYLAPGSTAPTVVLPNLAMANGIALSPDGKELWATEFGRNALYRVQLADPTHPTPLGTAIAYRFTGPAPDSMRIDADGNLYVAIYGQGRVLAFSPQGIPIGQILLPGREQGRNLKTTSMAIRPGTNEMVIVTGDDAGGPAMIFRTRVFAQAQTPPQSR